MKSKKLLDGDGVSVGFGDVELLGPKQDQHNGEPRVYLMKTPFQLQVLEETFAVNQNPSRQDRAKLSVKLGLTNLQLRTWFIERRTKERKMQSKKVVGTGDHVYAVTLLDGDGASVGFGDGDVEKLGPKQDQCELAENVSPLSDYIGYNMSKTKEHAWRNTNNGTPKKKQKLLDGDGDGDGDGVGVGFGDGDVELLCPKQDQCELAENVSPLSHNLEKSSSYQSDLVCVQGYKVKRSNATILEAIFKKHGDIAANCVLKTSSATTHFLEVVCEVVKRIQTNDMTEMVEDIECQVSDVEVVNINVSWIRAHFEAFNKRKEASKKYSLLTEAKLNAELVKRAAQKDLRDISAELMGVQERFIKAERCVRVMHLVEKNLNDNILETKAKLDSWEKHPVV